MSTTVPKELTDRELYESEGLANEFDRKYGGMKIINTSNGNGSYNGLKNTVFMAIVLGMGVAIWLQKDTNAEFAKQIAVLQIECRNNTQLRGAGP
jgi:hypothetical protein